MWRDPDFRRQMLLAFIEFIWVPIPRVGTPREWLLVIAAGGVLYTLATRLAAFYWP